MSEHQQNDNGVSAGPLTV
jgi:protein dpy-30